MPARRPTDVSEDDARLFRETVGTIRPLRSNESPPLPPRPGPRRRQKETLTDAPQPGFAGACDGAAVLRFLRPPHSPRRLQRLQKGRYRVEDELDLHHMGIVLAQASIERFLAEALAEGRRCVRIIHGKGLRSESGGSVLKALCAQLLYRHAGVLAYASAHPAQGGTGAVLVLLAADF